MALLALKVADPWVKATSDIFISVVKPLIAINRIQNKSFCSHNMCVLCIFIMSINTHTC